VPRQLKIDELNIGKQVLQLYNNGMSANKIAEQLNVNPINVINFIEKTDENTQKLVKREDKMAKENLMQALNLHEKMIEKIEDMEELLTQMKEADGKVVERRSKDYISAWNSIMSTLQWWTDRKIKLLETMENQIFRNAILEAIKGESPEVASKIRSIIEQKRKDLGLI